MNSSQTPGPNLEKLIGNNVVDPENWSVFSAAQLEAIESLDQVQVDALIDVRREIGHSPTAWLI